MVQRLKDKIAEIAEEQGWSVSFHDKERVLTEVEFECYSSVGQDYCFTITVVDNDPEEFVNELGYYCNGYDFEEEAARWIGDDGHGKNGAPYRIADILKSAKEIEGKLSGLQAAFEKASSELKDAARRKIKVQITETLQRIIEVDAYNEDDAVESARTMINRENAVLDYNDFVERNVEIYNE